MSLFDAFVFCADDISRARYKSICSRQMSLSTPRVLRRRHLPCVLQTNLYALNVPFRRPVFCADDISRERYRPICTPQLSLSALLCFATSPVRVTDPFVRTKCLLPSTRFSRPRHPPCVLQRRVSPSRRSLSCAQFPPPRHHDTPCAHYRTVCLCVDVPFRAPVSRF